MKKTFLIAVAGLFFLPGCDWFGLGSAEKQSGLVIVNVLEKELYDDCHIKGSINIPFDGDFAKKAEQAIAKDAEVVLYCSNYMCTASGYARTQLKERGFEKVWAYEAGMAEWYRQELPVGPDKAACNIGYLKRTMERPEGHESKPDEEITTSALKEKMGV